MTQRWPPQRGGEDTQVYLLQCPGTTHQAPSVTPSAASLESLRLLVTVAVTAADRQSGATDARACQPVLPVNSVPCRSITDDDRRDQSWARLECRDGNGQARRESQTVFASTRDAKWKKYTERRPNEPRPGERSAGTPHDDGRRPTAQSREHPSVRRAGGGLFVLALMGRWGVDLAWCIG